MRVWETERKGSDGRGGEGKARQGEKSVDELVGG
jgi:hypothetical protein